MKSLKTSIVLVIPALFLLLFFFIPLINIFALAFGILDGETIFTFSFLLEVLTHPLNRYFIIWDIQQAILTTFLCLLIGIPGSYILAHYKFPFRNLIRNLLTIPFILPPIVVLMGFISVFGHGSIINDLWRDLTGFRLIDIYNTYEGIILAHVFYNIPVIIRLTEIGWRNINPELIGVAKSLKASNWRILRKIQFPQIFPILAAASLLVFIYSFNSFAIVLVLGGVKFQTVEVRIYDYFWDRFDYNAAAALTMIQLFINILVILLYLYFSNKYEVPSERFSWKIENSFFKKPINIKSVVRTLFVGLYFVFVSIICVLPIVGVISASFTSVDNAFTFFNYSKLLDRDISTFIGLPPQSMIANSLLFGFGVILIAPILALLFNYGLNYETTKKGRPKVTLLRTFSGIIVILPLTVSSITLAFSLFSIYRETPIYDNIAIVIIIAQTLIAFPFANRIIAATRSNIDETIINVARSLGVSRLGVFLKIELPLLLPGIVIAGLFSFAISIGEFGATYFLSKTNFATIPVGIYRLVATRNIGTAAAFASILMLITVGSFMIIDRLGKVDFRL
ncbi:MAG: ABC transporter permease [Candidatus Hodarchaeales archaeon]|jgi:thiamine transport system permease protein